MKRWILLEEYLPESTGVYIITYENQSGFHTDVAIYDLDLNKWFWDEDEERAVTRKILAWQYLPEPYQANVDVNHKDIYYFAERREDKMTNKVPIWQKYTLTIEEAAEYFRIGQNRLRQLVADHPDADYILMIGNRVQIKRKLFEAYIDLATAV